MRKNMLAGNWKMNMSVASTKEYFEVMGQQLSGMSGIENLDLVIGAPYTLLATAADSKPAQFSISSQSVHWEDTGAFTGEISAAMLKELQVTHAIIGHSERRQFFGETDETVLRRTEKALSVGITPIVCVGELLADRESGRTEEVVRTQIEAVVSNIAATSEIVIAYEPVWAIGTGLAATSEQAEEVHAFIRSLLVNSYGQEIADKIRILYGGSMKPGNIDELMSQPNVDGGLVGGASLKPNDFLDMIKVAATK